MKMTQNELNIILKAHKKWLCGEEDGNRANLSNADLRDANLNNANLHGAILCSADLSGANLSYSDLRSVDLRSADLSGANLSYSDLRSVDLRRANLSDTNLHGVNLRGADLSGANLLDTELEYANLLGSNLSGAKGVPSAIDYMNSSFERTNDGYIVYKTFNGIFVAPSQWDIRPGSVLTENVDFNRADGCGCGINVAPMEWVRKHYKGNIWRCLIRWEWLPGVCVPYNTDGKIRCERVELLEVVK